MGIFVGFAAFFIMEKTMRVLGAEDEGASHGHSHSHSHSHSQGCFLGLDLSLDALRAVVVYAQLDIVRAESVVFDTELSEFG